MAVTALIISLISAAGSATAVVVAIRSRLKVTVTLQTSSAYAVNSQEQVPLAKVMVNVQGKALTVEDIAFEWVSPMPAPKSWGWGPPTAPELGLPWGADATLPAVAEMTAPIPPNAKCFLQDGETKPFTVCIRLYTDEWGDGTEWSGEVRAHVTMSSRKRAYVSNTTLLVFRPDILTTQIRQGRDQRITEEAADSEPQSPQDLL